MEALQTYSFLLRKGKYPLKMKRNLIKATEKKQDEKETRKYNKIKGMSKLNFKHIKMMYQRKREYAFSYAHGTFKKFHQITWP